MLIIILLLSFVIVALVFALWHMWYAYTVVKNRLRRETREVAQALHRAFDLLKEDVREQIELLEWARTKRELTEEEDKIIHQLRRDLDDAERFVGKELEDIENEVS
jgi:predicted Holliday junction resolvase-like endonuclease